MKSGKLVTRGLAENYTFPIKSTVALPNILLSKQELDFGMRTVGDSYEVNANFLFVMSLKTER